MDIISIVLTVLGIFAAIVIGIYQVRKSENIVQQTGQMKKPDLDCYFINEKFKDLSADSYCLWYPGDGNSMAIFYLVFCVHNKGDAAIEGSVITIKASSLCLSDDDSFVTEHISPKVFSGDVKRSIEKIKNETLISYKLPMLYQHSTFRIIEPFVFSETFVETTFDVGLKDKEIVKLSARVLFAYPITMTLINKNDPHKSITIQLECICGKNTDDVVKKYRSIRNKNEKDLIGKKVVGKRTILLDYDIDKVMSHEGKDLYVMKDIMNDAFVKAGILEYLDVIEESKKQDA